MSRPALRITLVLVLVGLAVAAPGASASIAAEAPLEAATQSAASAACCTVTYDAAKTHFQVTGIVSYKGTAVLFSFHGPCASPAGPGRAYVKSRWIPLRDVVAGDHTIDIVQKVNGKIVYSKSPKFFVRGTAQLRKPTATITSGPTGVATGTSALFKFKVTNASRVLCRLDARPWRSCVNWEQYGNLAPGPHVFEVRAYALGGPTYAKATRSFTLSAPAPG